MEDTVFDKIIRGEIKPDIVYENDWVLSFRDLNPQAPVHVLVIPKKKIKHFSEVKCQDTTWIAEYFKGISETAHKLGLEEDGYRVVFNNGNWGGQDVEYIHAHILGGRQMKWPPG